MRLKIRKAVGRKAANKPADVAIVQDLFRRCEENASPAASVKPFADWAGSYLGIPDFKLANTTPMFASVDHFSGYYTGPQSGPLPFQWPLHVFTPPKVRTPLDGKMTDELVAKIEEFQRKVMGTKVIDGVMSPTGPTFARLFAKARLTTSDDLFGSTTDTIGSTLNLDTVEELYKKQMTYNNEVNAAADFRKLVGRITQDTEVTDIRWAAYMLATTKHETMHTFQPIRERGWDAAIKPSANYWTPVKVKNAKGEDIENTYYGRGFVQLTWKTNYEKMGKNIGLGLQLLQEPDKALEFETAYKVMSYGMRNGSFTGVGLPKYINKDACDYKNARKIINALDRADDVAALAEGFEVILRLGMR